VSKSLDAALDYHAKGWMPIHVPRAAKNPNRQGWQHERHTLDDLRELFRNGANIGLLLGEPSGWLVDIDLDWPEARRLAWTILPATEMLSGRASAPASHFWYISDATLKTAKFLDPSAADGSRAMIVELRSTGCQTIVPPSVHPCGELYEWHGQLQPAKVDGFELLSRARKLAACALLTRHWKQGQRHQTALALSGMLLRAGWQRARVENFIRLAAAAADDDEVDDRVRAVETTEQRICRGDGATGIPVLSDLIGGKVVNCLRKWLDLTSGPTVFFGSETPKEIPDDDWPDPEPLPIGLLPVPRMTSHLIPEPFRAWLCDIAERMQCPLEYPAIGALVSLSSAVGNRMAIYPKRHDDWMVIPNLWGAVVGRPGVLKSPALDEAMRPVKRLVAQAGEEYKQRFKDWEFEKLRREAERKNLKEKINKAVKIGKHNELDSLRGELAVLDEAAAPSEHRYIVNDTTVEKLGELLNQNPRGLLLFRDELTGWLRTLDRDGHEADRAFYLEAWLGGNRFSYDRIGRGTLHIETVTLSILGGIQPSPLSQYLRSALSGGVGDDGLMQRFQLLVFPDVSSDWRNVDRYPESGAKNRAFEIYKDVTALDPKAIGAVSDEVGATPYLHFAGDAQDLFDGWRAELEIDLRTGKAGHPALESHLAKYRSLMPSLALLFHLIDRVSDRTTVSEISFEATHLATAWCTFLFEHAKRIYGMALNSTAHLAKSLAEHIEQGSLSNPFTAREIYLKHWTGLASAKEVAEPLDLLVDLGWLRPIPVQRGGRPTQHYYVNPKIGGRTP
jgi:hypothetical protein